MDFKSRFVGGGKATGTVVDGVDGAIVPPSAMAVTAAELFW